MLQDGGKCKLIFVVITEVNGNAPRDRVVFQDEFDCFWLCSNDWADFQKFMSAKQMQDILRHVFFCKLSCFGESFVCFFSAAKRA